MNVLFSSNDNYVRHLGVSLYSLLSNNQTEQKINCFVIENEIKSANLNNLRQIVNSFANADLFIIPFSKFKDKLKLDMPWPVSLSCYARLFVSELLPSEIDRVLYLDCDTVITSSLSELWNINLGENVVGAVQDQVAKNVKSAVGLETIDRYFNSGVLLINLKKWREMKIGDRCLQFIDEHAGKVIHHDQGVLNGILKTCWFRLPIKYNVMTIHYMISLSKIMKYYKDESSFYGKEEIALSKKCPAILHFTPSFTNHPWEYNCRHPLRSLYRNILNKTPWKDFPLEKNPNPWYVHLINLRYLYLPIL